MMFWYGNAGWPFWEVALMWAGVIAFWGLLIWAAYALITGATRRSGAGTRDGEHQDEERTGHARHILDERLARGEIDTDEYQRLRDVLASGDDRSPAAAGHAPGDGTV